MFSGRVQVMRGRGCPSAATKVWAAFARSALSEGGRAMPMKSLIGGQDSSLFESALFVGEGFEGVTKLSSAQKHISLPLGRLMRTYAVVVVVCRRCL